MKEKKFHVILDDEKKALEILDLYDKHLFKLSPEDIKKLKKEAEKNHEHL